MPSSIGVEPIEARPQRRAAKPARAKAIAARNAAAKSASGKPTSSKQASSRQASSRQTGSQLVYDALRDAIIALAIEPGSVLEETALCRQYKVSRTPVREALIRLSSEGLVEMQPNRGASVATLQFIDVVDHYEAMEIFQPIACHFAAVRSSAADLKAIRAALRQFCRAVERQDYEGIIRCNYDLHSAVAAASHNRCIERGYRQMLADKLRIAQHGLPKARNRATALAERFSGTAHISRRLVDAIAGGNGPGAEQIARELNDYVRGQVVAHFSSDLARDMRVFPPRPRSDAWRGVAGKASASKEIGGKIVKLNAKPRLRSAGA